MRRFFPILSVLILLASCINYDNATESIAVSLQLIPSEEIDASQLAGKTITLKSHEGRIIKLQTDSNGLACSYDIIPDLYSISVSWQLRKDLIATGNLPQQSITTSTKIEIPLTTAILRQLVISKVYMAGSKDKNNVNYLNGSYLEIYNQSDETVDAKGLYIGLLEAGSSMAYTLENLHEQHADSVVLLKQIFRIPTSAPHPVAPGGSILLVNSAIDHSQYSDMEYSLLDADFEAKDKQMKVTNNSEVPALEPIYLQTTTNLSNMNLVRGGPCGVVIFQTDEDVTAWPTTYKYPNTETKGAQWVLLPKRLIMDAVDILHRKNSGIDVKTKRLYTDIDAGYTALTSINGLDGEVIYRKMTEQTGSDGHALLMDTNNSSNDFQTSKTIKPREYSQTQTSND